MQKNIMIVQSRTTGRFLLKKVDGKWTFPSVVDNDPNVAVVYIAMDECGEALGQDVEDNDWILDVIPDSKNQMFLVWVSDEPKGKGDLEWCSMFMFPDNLDNITDVVMQNHTLIEKSISPPI